MNQFKIRESKLLKWTGQYSLKDWKLWFKLSFVVILAIALIEIYLRTLIVTSFYVQDINKIISDNKLVDITSLIEAGKNLNAKWITTSKEGIDSVISLITFNIGNSSGDFRATYSPFETIIYHTSFFTILSNILVLVWMCVALFNPRQEGNKGLLSERMTLISATYITITCLIYNTALRPVALAAGNGNKDTWEIVISNIENEIFHTVGPLVFVIYAIFGMQHREVKSFSLKDLQKTWMYAIVGLVSYGLYAIVRGLVKEAGGTPANSIYAYPYFFLQITSPNALLGIPGIAWFFMFVIIIALLCIGFSSLYRFLITKVQAKQLAK